MVYREADAQASMITDAMAMFEDCAHASPSLWVGDFNWSMLEPPDCSQSQVAAASCALVPTGSSSASAAQATSVTR